MRETCQYHVFYLVQVGECADIMRLICIKCGLERSEASFTMKRYKEYRLGPNDSMYTERNIPNEDRGLPLLDYLDWKNRGEK